LNGSKTSKEKMMEYEFDNVAVKDDYEFTTQDIVDDLGDFVEVMHPGTRKHYMIDCKTIKIIDGDSISLIAN